MDRTRARRPDRRRGRARRAYVAALAKNLVLVRRSAKVAPASGWLIAPYAVWAAFATALNAAIVARNPDA